MTNTFSGIETNLYGSAFTVPARITPDGEIQIAGTLPIKSLAGTPINVAGTVETKGTITVDIAPIQTSDVFKFFGTTFSATSGTPIPELQHTISGTFFLSGFIANHAGGPISIAELRVSNEIKARLAYNSAGNPHSTNMYVQPVALGEGTQTVQVFLKNQQAGNADVFVSYWGFQK